MIRESRTRIEFAENNREVLSGMDEGFPCSSTRNESWRYIGNEVPWHWHAYLEFTYVMDGKLTVRTADHSFQAERGDLIFFNSNVLHSMGFPEKCVYMSTLFDMRFLSGDFSSAIEQKYFAPVIGSHWIQGLLFRPDTPNHVRMAEAMISMLEFMAEEPEGYEMLVREKLSRLWMLLFAETADIRAAGKEASSQDTERTKKMLAYIYAHYMEPITLGDIAASAGVSPRECTRVFGKSVSRSPVRFLIDYRVHMAAQKLLLTGDSISRIAESCGFSSDSYFGKAFRATFGCTPREYRKRR